MTSVSSDPQVVKSHHYSASFHLMKGQSSFTCHTTKREKISINKTLAHLFQKKLKTIHIHKTEGSPEHSQHLGCQWRRELVTTYDCQTAAAWDPSPPMQQPGGVARLTRSARIRSLHKLSCFSSGSHPLSFDL